MATDQHGISFDDTCDAFTVACQHAAHWKHNYSGAAYTTRIVQAIIDLEAAIALVKSNPKIAEAFNSKALAQLAVAARRAMEGI